MIKFRFEPLKNREGIIICLFFAVWGEWIICVWSEKLMMNIELQKVINFKQIFIRETIVLHYLTNTHKLRNPDTLCYILKCWYRKHNQKSCKENKCKIIPISHISQAFCILCDFTVKLMRVNSIYSRSHGKRIEHQWYTSAFKIMPVLLCLYERPSLKPSLKRLSWDTLASAWKWKIKVTRFKRLHNSKCHACKFQCSNYYKITQMLAPILT